MSKRLGEKVQVTTPDETRRHFLQMFDHFRSVSDWIKHNADRTDYNLCIFNLLEATAVYLHFAAVGTEQHVSILALATRSVYELDLRARHVLASSENMVAWQSEAVLDQIEIYESLLRIPNSPEGVKPIPS